MPPHTPRLEAVRQLRRLARRLHRTAADDPWGAYLAGVEPALAAAPRVHRFAQIPRLGEAGLAPLPLAIWMESDGAAAARDSVSAGTHAPAQLLAGPLVDALNETRAEWVLLLGAGDVLAPPAIERFGQAAALAPDVAVITCDSDGLDPAGRRLAPRFRPGPSPDRWLACDDSGSVLLVARDAAVAAVASLRAGEAWRHELVLALAGPAAQRAAHVPLLLSHRLGAPHASGAAAAGTIEGVLARDEPGARIELVRGVRRVRRPPATEPSVEVVVCFRDRAELLRRCLDSLLALTDYEHLRVALVDNGSEQAQTLELVARHERDPRIRVRRDPSPFNFAALNNRAAQTSQADVLVFLNNDTEIVDPGWIATLLEEAMRPQVGAVAPLLLYPDRSVQHAGVALGMHDYAGHPFAGLSSDSLTPFGRPDGGTRNWLAVTAACMMVQRAKFAEVGGFDEGFVVAGNDVDLCLRLTRAGYRSLCVPHAVLVHDESRSRGGHIDPGDFVRSEASYGEFRTVGDPFYNPSLTLRRTDCGVRTRAEEP